MESVDIKTIESIIVFFWAHRHDCVVFVFIDLELWVDTRPGNLEVHVVEVLLNIWGLQDHLFGLLFGAGDLDFVLFDATHHLLEFVVHNIWHQVEEDVFAALESSLFTELFRPKGWEVRFTCFRWNKQGVDDFVKLNRLNIGVFKLFLGVHRN